MTMPLLRPGFRPFTSVRCRVAAHALALALAGAGPVARAQTLAVDDTFNPQVIDRSAAVADSTLLLLDDGRILARGPFTFAGATPASGLVRLLASGAHDPTFAFAGNGIEPGFFQSSARAIPLSDGRLLVVRAQQRPGSVPLVESTVAERYLADGSRDLTYASTTLLQGYISFAVPAPDGRIIVAGLFATFAGAPREGLARLNADGTPDLTFAPALLGPMTVVSSVVVAADRRVTAAGYATSPAPDASFIGRFLPDGTRDASFNPAINVAPGALPPRLLAAQADGKILLEGVPALRWNADGSHDPTFAPALPAGDALTHAVAFTDGRLLVQHEPNARQPLGLSSVRMLAADGRLLMDYRGALRETGMLQIHAIAPDGGFLLRRGDAVVISNLPTSGGADSSAQITAVNVRFTRVSASGEIGNTFVPSVGRTGSVRQLATRSDGGVLISGAFDLVNGVECPGLARLRADGSLDPNFTLPEMPAATRSRRFELELVQPDERLLVSMPVSFGSGRSTVIQRLQTDGTLDPSLPADSPLARSSGPLLDVDAQGRIIMAELEFTSPSTITEHLTIFNHDGSRAVVLPTVFTEPRVSIPLPGAFYPMIQEARAQPDGGLLVAGGFGAANGKTMPGIARLRSDGSLDPAYAPGIAADDVLATPMPIRGGRALVSLARTRGALTTLSTVRLLADGTVDPTFRTAPGEVITFGKEQPDGTILGMGYELRRWFADGTRDLNVVANFSVAAQGRVGVWDAALLADGRIYVGGDLNGVITSPRTGIARLVRREQPGITVQPQPRTIVAGRSAYLQVAIGDFEDASYQWQRNGTDLPGATDSRLVLDPVGAGQAGAYRVIVTAGGATYVSNEVALVVAPNTARLANFSARSRVRPGAAPQIAGFVTESAVVRPVLLRAIGRGLPWDRPAQSLARPTLGLFAGPDEIARNTGGARGAAVEVVADRVGAFRPVGGAGMDPNVFPVADSALVRDFATGVFTAQTSSVDARDGVSLFEFYDATPVPTPGFVKNVSLRGRTAPDLDTMIGGFFVAGQGPLTLLLRVVGPELERWDVPDPLANPHLTLFLGARTIASNDDWEHQLDPGPIAVSAAAAATGAFPLDSASTSAALVVSLEPGGYTFHATGTSAAGGEVLLEIYVVEE